MSGTRGMCRGVTPCGLAPRRGWKACGLFGANRSGAPCGRARVRLSACSRVRVRTVVRHAWRVSRPDAVRAGAVEVMESGWHGAELTKTDAAWCGVVVGTGRARLAGWRGVKCR